MHALMPLMFLLTVLAPQSQTVAQSKDASPWQTIRSAAGRFSVAMPGKPVEGKQIVEFVFGKVAVHTYSLEVDSGAFIASYNDYPPKLLKKTTPAKMLGGVRNGILQMVKAKLTSEKKITVQGKPGLQFCAEVPQRNAMLTARVVLKGARLYQVLAVGEKGQLDQKAVSRFVGSLKLL